MKRYKKCVFCLFLSAVLFFSGCTQYEEVPAISSPDTAYRFAWQYILSEIENHYETFVIPDAKITRFEPVAYYRKAQANIHVYALEYAFFATWDYGWIPGGDGSGSTYLFISEQNGDIRLLAAATAGNVLNNGGYAGMAEVLIQNNNSADYAKQSIWQDEDNQAEINEAIRAAEEFFSMDDCQIINIWYDRHISAALQAAASEDIPPTENNTVILCGDIYFKSNGAYKTGQLFHNANIILTRETTDDKWIVKNYGY